MKLNELTQSEINIYNNLKKQIDVVFKHSHECAFKTRERYRDSMYSFAKFLAKEYRKQNIGKIKNTHIEKYVKYMQEKDYSTSYVTTNVSAIRYFYDKKTGGRFIIKSNRGLGVNARRKDERIGENRSISDESFHDLLNKTEFLGRQDFMLEIKLADRFGLRIHEVFSLRHSKIREAFKTGELKIKGKGGLIRTLNLSVRDKDFLKEVEQYKKTKVDRIFVSSTEKTHLKIKELQKFIRDYRDVKGGDYEYIFHSIRHRYAQKLYSELRRCGITDSEARFIVSKRLGHNRISVSDIYLN